MIVINNQAGVQLVYLTLSENTTISTPVYLFTALAKDTNELVEFTLTVIESNSRWDVCQIDGSLFVEGQYTYEAKETTESKIVERGLLFVNNPLKATGWDSYEENNGADQETRGRL